MHREKKAHNAKRVTKSKRYNREGERCISMSNGQTERQRDAQRKCKDKNARAECVGKCKDRVQRCMQRQSRKKDTCRMHIDKKAQNAKRVTKSKG